MANKHPLKIFKKQEVTQYYSTRKTTTTSQTNQLTKPAKPKTPKIYIHMNYTKGQTIIMSYFCKSI